MLQLGEFSFTVIQLNRHIHRLESRIVEHHNDILKLDNLTNRGDYFHESDLLSQMKAQHQKSAFYP